ncbi:MAG: hypothetical protein PUH96_07745 [Coriobacteriaceae bacterium]|nr:hypothetical protein [Coriobacteriaceae bacterium]
MSGVASMMPSSACVSTMCLMEWNGVVRSKAGRSSPARLSFCLGAENRSANGAARRAVTCCGVVDLPYHRSMTGFK